MKSQGKILKKVLMVIGIIIVILVLAMYFFGNQALVKGISSGATSALKVNVSLGGLHLGILRGEVGISKLTVDNPAGYSEKALLTLGDASVKAQMGSLLTKTVEIDSIKLDGISLVIEQKGLSTNLQDLLNNISASSPPADRTAPKPEEEKSAGKNLHIRLLEITNVNVKVKVMGATEIPLKLNTIKMEDIGKEDKVDVAALTSKILTAIASSVAKEGSGIIPSDITGGLNSGLKGLENIGGSLLKEGKGAGSGIDNAIKGLFDKKK
jgi:hypothetical protein